MAGFSFRRDLLTKPSFGGAKRALPSLSDTEREAIEAGDVWWDADIFSGNPDWNRLLAFAPARLSAEEQAFLDGPVEELCAMVDDWEINWTLHDLPPEVWDFLKAKKNTASIAKDRLRIIIAQERTNRGGPDYLPLLQRELLEVIRKYVSVDVDAVKVDVVKEGEHDILDISVALPDERASAA